MASATSGPNTRATPGPNAHAWLTVFVLFITQIISTIDRGMLALVIDPVRHDLDISEMQIALLQGIAFTIFYVTIGLPLGAVADVVNRRRLLIAGIVVWSAATVAGGFAQGFGAMFASRIFIGVGEAVLGPCAVTMISDLFPPEKRGRPVALYVFGSMIAYGLGSLICGLILDLAPKGVFAAWPVISGLAPWRIVFVLVGASGVVLLALLSIVREPQRSASSQNPASKLNFCAGLAEMGRNYRIFVPFYLALGLFATGAVAATGWGAVFLTRTYGYDVGTAGKLLGISQLLWSVLGVAVASFGVDLVGKRFGVVGRIRLGAILTLLTLPAILSGLVSEGTVAIVLLGEVMFVMAIYGTAMLSSLSEIAPPSLRGFAVALYAFVMTMIGGSLGPVAIAWFTETVFADPRAVGSSMALVGTVALGLSAICAFFAASGIQSLKEVTS